MFHDQSFNDKLTNNIISFEQLGPDHEVLGSNMTRGGIQLMAVPHLTAQSLSLSFFHHLDIT